MGKVFASKTFREKTDVPRGHHFPQLQVYVTIDGGSVFFTWRHKFKAPADVHPSLDAFSGKFTDGAAEMTKREQQGLIHSLQALEASAALSEKR